jgi:hypothetical protein
MSAILFFDGRTVLHIIYFNVVGTQQQYINIKLSFREFDSPYFELILKRNVRKSRISLGKQTSLLYL